MIYHKCKEFTYREFIEGYLTDSQKGTYKSALWLFGHGPRGAGRTRVLAATFITLALETGAVVDIFDHHAPTRPESFRFISEEINNMLFTINEELKAHNFGKDVLRWSINLANRTLWVGHEINYSNGTLPYKKESKQTKLC